MAPSDADDRRVLDRQLGRRIRAARTAKGMSRDSLAASLGVSFRQVEKYERGSTPVTSSRLQAIAALLDTNADDLLGSTSSKDFDSVLFSASSREASELMRLWPDIPREIRLCLLALVRALANPSEPD